MVYTENENYFPEELKRKLYEIAENNNADWQGTPDPRGKRKMSINTSTFLNVNKAGVFESKHDEQNDQNMNEAFENNEIEIDNENAQEVSCFPTDMTCEHSCSKN